MVNYKPNLQTIGELGIRVPNDVTLVMLYEFANYGALVDTMKETDSITAPFQVPTGKKWVNILIRTLASATKGYCNWYQGDSEDAETTWKFQSGTNSLGTTEFLARFEIAAEKYLVFRPETTQILLNHCIGYLEDV